MGNYVTTDDLVKEGLPAGTDPARVTRRIAKWEAIVEKVTRQVFREIEPGELTFDGDNSRYLHFSLPLISVSSLKVNGESTALSSDEYRVYNGRSAPQDDRGNPRIELTGYRDGSIFSTRTHSIFARGYDQKVTAKWGYTEADGSCPAPVKDAIIQLVLMDLDGVFEKITGGTRTQPLTPIRRERTDGHEIEYMEINDVRLTYTNIPKDIYDLLMMYRPPIGVAVPDPVIYSTLTLAELAEPL